MATTEAPFSFTTKVNGDLLTVRGETVSQFVDRLRELAEDPQIEEALGTVQALGGVAAAVAGLGATVIASTAPATAPTPSTSEGPTLLTDKYGGEWTYNHPDAPDLPDGRGKYALHAWKSKAGKFLKAWKDPAKGPKPFSPGSEEAPLIWV